MKREKAEENYPESSLCRMHRRIDVGRIEQHRTQSSWGSACRMPSFPQQLSVQKGLISILKVLPQWWADIRINACYIAGLYWLLRRKHLTSQHVAPRC